jgi:LytS/YehU family sensor histidine kinase
MWVGLWKGNAIVTDYVSCKIPWIKYPIKRLVVGVLSTMAYSLLAIMILLKGFETLFGFNLGDEYVETIYISLAVTFLISLVLHSRAFFLHWKNAALEAEKYQKESIEAKYESLRNQVNPHFLFNSLNALTNLVYEDQDKAVKFIKQLSEVYRYVLDTRGQEAVSLDQELKFLASYLYLQQIRFGDKLDVQFHLDGLSSRVAPLALQMLIENAIKHNVVSEEDPLHIRLYYDTEYIIIENNLQEKSLFREPSSGIGLDNISKRYEFLSGKKVEVVKTEKSFIVKLPIIPIA